MDCFFFWFNCVLVKRFVMLYFVFDFVWLVCKGSVIYYELGLCFFNLILRFWIWSCFCCCLCFWWLIIWIWKEEFVIVEIGWGKWLFGFVNIGWIFGLFWCGVLSLKVLWKWRLYYVNEIWFVLGKNWKF